MARISIDPTEVKKHPKFHAFRKKLDWQPHHAFGFLCAFWGEVANTEANESGDISDWTPDFLADRIVTNNVDPNRLWEALVPGYIEVRPNERYFVRDWLEIFGATLRQKYHNTDKQKLVEIWSSYGRIYGRDSKPKSTDRSEEAEGKSKGNDATSFSIEKENWFPDIIEEPSKDREKTGNPSFPLSWETEREKEGPPGEPAAPRTRTSLAEDGTEMSDRRDPKARPVVHVLFDLIQKRLDDMAGEPVTLAHGVWGDKLKRLLKANYGPQEIMSRFDNYLASTDRIVAANRNNGGYFYQRFNDLKDGPITANQGKDHGRRSFDDGAATIHAEPEPIY